MFGWGPSENILVNLSSVFGVFVHASDWAENLSFLSNMQVAHLQQQPEPLPAPPKQNAHTICFLMTDGDNLQWILNSFATSAAWFGSPQRGAVPVGWTLSPALAELAPTVLQAIYNNCTRTAGGSDTIVASPSGLGYCYPDTYANVTAFAALTDSFLNKANMTGIVNIIGNNPDSKYLVPYLQQPSIAAIFYYLYENYAGLDGSISFVNNKPIIGARWQLWPGVFDNTTSLIAKINAAPRNISSALSYSLIPVHVWNANISMVVDVVAGLDAVGVQVVTPKQFVALITENIKRESQ